MNTTMTNPNVSMIPATKRSVQAGGQLHVVKNLRVAAYCRVSTDGENQQTSYAEQKKFYTTLIRNTEGWKFAGIYADEAISGTSRARRKEFNRMMQDALEGHIDYIVTKSISRFARNTVDTLNCVRQLRQMEPPVGIFFEKENIDTLDAKGELILTILSALAQDESRSQSDNIRWAFQKRFQEGKAHVNLNKFLGYKMGADGEWEIVPEEARTVRYIFARFNYGDSVRSIAQQLNEMGWLTINKKQWTHCSVANILKNEKYVGDCEMQKTITKDFLTHRSTMNMGEAPRYYIRDHHVAIIDRQTWDRTQAIFKERGNRTAHKKADEKKKLATGPVFTNLVCGAVQPATGKMCGEPLYRVNYQSTPAHYTDERGVSEEEAAAGFKDKYRYSYSVWRCQSKKKMQPNAEENLMTADEGVRNRSLSPRKEGVCPSAVYYEIALEQSFMEMIYRIKRDMEENGENAWLAQEFDCAYKKAVTLQKSGGSAERIGLLDIRIRELEESLNHTHAKHVEALRLELIEKNEEVRRKLNSGEISIDEIDIRLQEGILGGDMAQMGFGNIADVEEGSPAFHYGQLIKDLKMKMSQLRREKEQLEAEQSGAVTLKKNYEFFLRCLRELPETNAAGMKLNVNRLDTDGSIFRTADGSVRVGAKHAWSSGEVKISQEKLAQAPDFLPFERGMYFAFVTGGVGKGDKVEFTTNFGVKLTSVGNSRTLSGFLGFRKAEKDGTVQFLTENWQVNGKPINYSRTKR